MPAESALTIADGIAVKRPGDLTLALLGEWLDGMAVVEDEDAAEAMFVLMERCKLVVEGAGAVGVAALLGGQVAPAPRGTTVAVLSGGNVDPGLLLSIARRHETLAGRRLVVLTRVPDRPGALAGLLDLRRRGRRQRRRRLPRARGLRPARARDRRRARARDARARARRPRACGDARARATPRSRSSSAMPARPGYVTVVTQRLGRREACEQQDALDRHLDGGRHRRRRLVGRHRAGPRRADLRRLADLRRGRVVRDRLPLLRALHRAQGARGRREPRHARRAARQRRSTTSRPTGASSSATTSPRSPAPARSSARCSPRRWATCPGTIWIIVGVIFAGAVQDMVDPVLLDAPRRQVARPDGARRDRAGRRRRRAARRLRDHDHPARRPGARRRQRAGAVAVGHVLARDDDPDRVPHGLLPARAAARARARDDRDRRDAAARRDRARRRRRRLEPRRRRSRSRPRRSRSA